jgi:hypothetical protein
MAACCKLEGGLYSANVVLGRLFDVCTPEVDAMVEQMLGYAADMATNHTSKQTSHYCMVCAADICLSCSSALGTLVIGHQTAR